MTSVTSKPVMPGHFVEPLAVEGGELLTGQRRGPERLVERFHPGDANGRSRHDAQGVIGGGGRESNPPDGDHPSHPL